MHSTKDSVGRCCDSSLAVAVPLSCKLFCGWFLCSSDNGHSRGFKELIPNFAIRDSSNDEHRLPTSSTCVNLLKVTASISGSSIDLTGFYVASPISKREDTPREAPASYYSRCRV
jgi:hypothetical protein